MSADVEQKPGSAPRDLSMEEIEELRMISAFNAADLRRMWMKFQEFNGDENQGLSSDDFLNIPAVALNPLKGQLLKCFEFDDAGYIPFKRFCVGMSVFSHHGDKKLKLQAAFKIHDINGDGKICKDDLLHYMRLVSDFGDLDKAEVDERLGAVVQHTLEEASSAQNLDSLSYDDFVKVIAPTDFATRLVISII